MGNCIRYKTEEREQGTLDLESFASNSGEKEVRDQGTLTLENSTRNNDTNYERRCDWCIALDRTGVLGSGDCTCPNTVGSCSCPPGAAPLPSCVFYSPRIKALRDGERTEEQTTQDHWTSVDPETEAEWTRVGEDNRKYFDEVLAKHPEWGCLFTQFQDLEVGAKIGEGAQAEVYEAMSPSSWHPVWSNPGYLVAKVWREGFLLRDLARHWPTQMLSKLAHKDGNSPVQHILGGTFIRDGKFKNRFAFVMERRWLDLRSHIDHRMLHMLNNNSHGPPFRSMNQVLRLISTILLGLGRLHNSRIIHRDIKASNVLLSNLSSLRDFFFVADYECSVGITGTEFWNFGEHLRF